MGRANVNDVEYLAARLHGRRSRLAEAGRLDEFVRLTRVPELQQVLYPEAGFHGTADFQRRLAQDLAAELSSWLRHLEGAGADLIAWMLVRFQVENLKVLVRGRANGTPLPALRDHLIALPRDLEVDLEGLMSAESWVTFADRLPTPALRRALRKTAGLPANHAQSFFLEAALDREYFRELLVRAERLAEADRELVQPIVLQEVDLFHLMLVARGRFHYGLSADLLRPFHVRGSRMPSERFNGMLAAPDLMTVASFAVGRAIDAVPAEKKTTGASAAVDPADLEALGWRRFLRLANRAFRWSHMGLAAIVGFAGLRRVEVANLITLSEGIRARIAAETLRARLIPRGDRETAYV